MSDLTSVVLIQENGDKTSYTIRDKAATNRLAVMAEDVSKSLKLSEQSSSDVETMTETITKMQENADAVDASVSSLDDRVTSVETKESSLEKKHSALDLTVQNMQTNLTEEIARAKATEGERENLTASSKDTLVDAINWVQTRAEKAIENVGTLSDLTTEEKTDIVLAINELVAAVNKVSTTLQSTTETLSAADESIAGRVTSMEEKVATIAEKVGVSFNTDSEASSASETGDITSDTTQSDAKADAATA